MEALRISLNSALTQGCFQKWKHPAHPAALLPGQWQLGFFFFFFSISKPGISMRCGTEGASHQNPLEFLLLA
ncbi:hypothetical protein Q8G50_33325, partial [Klebsiella pneumoniae]